MTNDREKLANYSWMRKGEDAPRAKLKEADVRTIRRELDEGIIVAEVARRHNVSASTISSIKVGHTWKSVV